MRFLRPVVLCAVFCLLVIGLGTADDHIPMNDGVPTPLTMLSKGESKMYRTQPIDVPAPGYVVLSLTTFSGIADGYAGYNDATIGLWNLTKAVPESIKLPRTQFHTGTVFIKVVGYTDCAYTLLYSAHKMDGTALPITLMEGVPQMSLVGNEDYTDFVYDFTSNGPLSFSVTSFGGDPDILVVTESGNPPAREDHYTWRTYELGSDVLFISPDDPGYEAAMKYYPSLYGYGYTQCAVTASNTSVLLLMERMPHVDYVVEDEMRQFKFYHAGSSNIRITVEALSDEGDADIFVSTLPNPTTTNCYWWGIQFGRGEEVVIRSSDQHYESDSMYYVAIYGYVNTDFSISVQSEGESEILPDGQPLYANVSSGRPAFYVYDSRDTTAGLEFSLTNVQGKCQFYSSTSNPMPSAEPGKHDRAGVDVPGGQNIEFDTQEVQVSMYYIGVYSVDYNAGCLVVGATTAETVALLDGEPLYGEFAPERVYRRYSFDIARDDLDVTISVIPFGEGDPDLLGAIGYKPVEDKYMWISMHFGSDSFTILPTDPNFQLGTLQIAVYGYTETDFGIVAHTSNENAMLTDGVPLSDEVFEGSYKFFTLPVPAKDVALSISVATSVGDSDLFAGEGDRYMKPTLLHHQYSAMSFGGDFLVISETFAGDWHMGVYGFSNSSFTITASILQPGDYVEIPEGRATPDELQKEEVRQYVMFLQEVEDFQISLTCFSGFTRTYVRRVGPASETEYDASSVEKYPGNHINITKEQSFFDTGIWYLYVVADEDAMFEVMYTYAMVGTEALLSDGVPLLGSARSPMQYHTYVAYREEEFFWQLSLQMLSGAADVYVSLTPNPGPMNSIAVASGPGNHVLQIPSSFIFRDVWLTQVFVSVSPKTSDSKYFIFAASPDAEVTLIRGYRLLLHSNSPLYRRFKTGVFVNNAAVTTETFSCTPGIPPTFYFAQNERPDIRNHSRVSNIAGLSSVITADTIGDENCLFEYSVLGGVGNESPIFSAVRKSTEVPSPMTSVVHVSIDQVDKMMATVKWEPSVTADVEYSVVMAYAYDEGGLHTNLQTPCGCEYSAVKQTDFMPASSFDQQQGNLIYTFRAPRPQLYSFSVLVRSKEGIVRNYQPMVDVQVMGEATFLKHNDIISGAIAVGNRQNFVFLFSENDDPEQFLVSVTPYSGNSATYVDYWLQPNTTSPTAYRDTSKYPGNVVLIHRDEYRVGVWFCSVFSTGNTDLLFHLVFRTGNDPIPLLDGNPRIFSSYQNAIDVFSFSYDIPAGHEDDTVDILASVITGKVDLLLGRDPNLSIENATAVSVGDGTRFLYIQQRTFGTGVQTLYLGIHSKKLGTSEYVLGVNTPTAETFLLRGVTSQYRVSDTQSRIFNVLAPKTLAHLELSVDTCTEVPALTFYMKKNSVPTTKDYDMNSTVVATYSSFLEFDNAEQGEYYILVPPVPEGDVVFSITRISNGEHPYPTVSAVQLVDNKTPSELSIKFAPATETASALEYNVYVGESQFSKTLANNLETVCGCEYNKFGSTGFQKPTVFKKDKDGNQLYTFTDLPASTYTVNVVVRDQDGLTKAYTSLKNIEVTGLIIPLTWGKKVSSSVSKDKKQIFAFSVPNLVTFHLSIVPISGVVQSCAAPGAPPEPTPGGDSKCDTHTHPGNAITVAYDDPLFAVGQWYLTVGGVIDSRFDVVLYYENVNVPLTVGVPMVGELENGESTVYSVPVNFTLLHADDTVEFSVKLMSGSASVLCSLDNHPTESNSFAGSNGPGNIFLSVLASDITSLRKVVSVYVAVSTSTANAKFMITVATRIDDTHLVRDFGVRSFATPTAPRHYTGQVIGEATDVIFTAESCDNNPAPMFYFAADYTPDVTHNEGHATVYNTVSNLTHTHAAAEDVNYFLSAYANANNGNSFSVRMETSNDMPSVPRTGAVTISGVGTTSLSIQFPQAVGTGNFLYGCFITTYLSPSAHMNQFTTSCACENQAFFHSEFLPFQLFDRGSNDGTMEYEFKNLQTENTYTVNVVVKTEEGELYPYQKATAEHNVRSSLDFQSEHPLSGGSIFLVVVLCLACVYLIGGVVLNLVRGKRGFETIPNYEFWLDLPGLVALGYDFLFSCFNVEPPATYEEYAYPRTNDDINIVDDDDGGPLPTSGAYGTV